MSSRVVWQLGHALSVQNETCFLKHLFRNYRNTDKLGWVAAGKMDSFTGSVMTMGIDLSVIKSSFNKFCVVVYKLNLVKENLSNQEKNKVQQGGELNC